MELTADPGKEPVVNAAVQRIISEENQERSRMTETSFEEEGSGEAGIFCISKSDLMSEASSYIRGSRMILGSISAVLLLAGFTNYFNIMVTGFLARKRELDIMESIGMTQRQKRKLIADDDCGDGGIPAGPVLYGAEAFLFCIQLAGAGDAASDRRAGRDKRGDGMEDVQSGEGPREMICRYIIF